MGQIQFMGSILLAVLFATAIMTYAINFGDENNAAQKIGDDAQIVQQVTNLNNSLQTYKLQVNTSTRALLNTKKESGDSSPTSAGEFTGGVDSATSGLKAVLRTLNNKVLGNDKKGLGIFLVSLFSFLVLIGGLYVWKTLRGDPD